MFPFVPRKIARSARNGASPARGAGLNDTRIGSTSQAETVVSSDPLAGSSTVPQTKGKGKQTKDCPQFLNADHAFLICLALSDHALWSDSDLRRTIVSGEDGYIPLSYILHHPVILSAADHFPKEAIVVKAIREHASGTFDVRIRVSAPSRATWYGQDDIASDDTGCYEIRRTDWQAALQRSYNYARSEWESKTIYAENIPLQYRTVAGIYHFISSILLRPTSSAASLPLVQRIWLPPHHQDGPEDQPKFKGFALITLLQSEDTEYLLSHWPWNPRRTDLHDVKDITEAHAATKFGFRTLSKMQWDRHCEEYVAYRKRLLDEITRAEAHTDDQTDTDRHVHNSELRTSAIITNVDSEACSTQPSSSSPLTDLSSRYPYGCLVFVRNVHPETNKTTLRSLFLQAFSESQPHDQLQDGLDYVDFSKGMDTCYLRLATPRHTQQLTAFFNANLKLQAHGTDSKGAQPSSLEKPKSITVEVVDGTREELYWNKVPEKVRRQAVAKAVAQSVMRTTRVDLDGQRDAVPEGKRKRKRRKTSG